MKINAVQNADIQTIYQKNEKRTEGQEKEKDRKAIYAGELNFINDSKSKKEKTVQNAMQIVYQQFKRQDEVDTILEESQDQIDTLRKKVGESKEGILSLDKQKAKLKEEMEIEDGSKEQQDLEVLEKAYQLEREGTLYKLTKEEREQIQNIGSLTDYQKMALSLERSKEYYYDQLDTDSKGIAQNMAVIQGTKKKLLESEPMLEAKKQADKLLESASKEEIQMLLEEGKEHIDEIQGKSEKEQKQERAAEKGENGEKIEIEKRETIKNIEQTTGEIDEEIKKLKEKIEKLYASIGHSGKSTGYFVDQFL